MPLSTCRYWLLDICAVVGHIILALYLLTTGLQHLIRGRTEAVTKKLNQWLYRKVWQKRVFWPLDTLQWGNVTSNTNNNLSCFNTPVSKSPAVSQSWHQHWPLNTNQPWQQGVRKLAGKITFLLCQSKCVQSSVKKRVSITTHRVYTQTVTRPEKDRGGRAASVPQRDKNKLVGRVAATDINGYLSTSISAVQQCSLFV